MDPARQFWSGYVGMGNNPVNGVDPDGEFCVPCITAVIGAIGNVGADLYKGTYTLKDVWNGNGDSRFLFSTSIIEGAVGGALAGVGGIAFAEGAIVLGELMLYSAGTSMITDVMRQGIESEVTGSNINLFDTGVAGLAGGLTAGLTTPFSRLTKRISSEFFRESASGSLGEFTTKGLEGVIQVTKEEYEKYHNGVHFNEYKIPEQLDQIVVKP